MAPRCAHIGLAFLAILLLASPAGAQPLAAIRAKKIAESSASPPALLPATSASGPVTPAHGLPVDDQPTSFWKGWRGSVQAGVNGSSGNSENFNLRMGFSAERKTKPMETRADAVYSWATDGGEKTKSRAEANLRNDWNFNESPWFVFTVGKAEFDEFQDWRWRLSAMVGPGYAIIRNDKTTLKARSGFGFSQELGGQSNEFYPELDFGMDFEHQLTERQKLFATGDYYPRIEDFADYRTVTKAGWEIIVDPEMNLLLKLGIEHRHQSEPGEGFKKNDLDYFAMMGWRF